MCMRRNIAPQASAWRRKVCHAASRRWYSAVPARTPSSRGAARRWQSALYRKPVSAPRRDTKRGASSPPSADNGRNGRWQRAGSGGDPQEPAAASGERRTRRSAVTVPRTTSRAPRADKATCARLPARIVSRTAAARVGARGGGQSKLRAAVAGCVRRGAAPQRTRRRAAAACSEGPPCLARGAGRLRPSRLPRRHGAPRRAVGARWQSSVTNAGGSAGGGAMTAKVARTPRQSRMSDIYCNPAAHEHPSLPLPAGAQTMPPEKT